MRRTIMLLWLSAAVMLLQIPSNGQPKWVLTEIPALDGASSSAVDINDSGYVLVNIGYGGGITKPYLWKAGHFIPLTGIENGSGIRVNKHKTVMGQNWIWSPDGTLRYVTHPSGVQLRDLNNLGWVVGNTLYDAHGAPHAFYATPPGYTPIFLEEENVTNPNRQNGTIAYAINDLWAGYTGQAAPIVGLTADFYSSSQLRRAVKWAWYQDHPFHLYIIHPLSPPPNPHPLWMLSVAVDVNYESIAVGNAMGDTPLIWESDGTLNVLPRPNPLGPCIATRLSDGSTPFILGKATDLQNRVVYDVYWKDGNIHKVPDLLPANSGWTINDVTSVNRRGVFVGRGTYQGKPRGFVTSGEVDLIVDHVSIWQSVEDADINDNRSIDLVKDKQAAALVYVDALLPETISKDVTLEVKIGQSPPMRLSIPAEEFKAIVQNKETGENYVPFLFLPSNVNMTPVTAKIDPDDDIAETDEDNNEVKPAVEIEIKETNSIQIVYVPIREVKQRLPPDNLTYGPLDLGKFSEYSQSETRFIGDAYPVVPGNVTPMQKESILGEQSMDLDLLKIQEIKTKVPTALVGIGIVPADYLSYHGRPDAVGFIRSGILGAALSNATASGTVAHELGHVLGLYPPPSPEEYKLVDCGYFAYKFDFLDTKKILAGFVCFMGAAGCGDPWVDRPDYVHLFRRLRVNAQDPAILLVGGIIDSDNRVEIVTTSAYREGYPDVVEPGEYTLVGYAFDGAECVKIPFSAPFEAIVEPQGAVTTSEAAFGFRIPYPDALARIEIKHQETVLTSFPVQSKYLAEAIEGLPAGAFVKPPKDAETKRKTMLNKVTAFEGILVKGDLQGAFNKLHNDIEKHLKTWLLDGDYSTSPLDYTKAEVLELVNDISRRIELQLGSGKQKNKPDGESNRMGLEQNSPNPFNPSTMIRYSLLEQTRVTLLIYNTIGQQVARLVDGDQTAGIHEVIFDGSMLTSGIYLYRIQAGDFVQTKKMLLVK